MVMIIVPPQVIFCLLSDLCNRELWRADLRYQTQVRISSTLINSLSEADCTGLTYKSHVELLSYLIIYSSGKMSGLLECQALFLNIITFSVCVFGGGGGGGGGGGAKLK